jgi:rsbT co-antagonist protein RsbR
MDLYVDISMSVVGEEYLGRKEDQIRRQQHAIMELSAPVLPVRERLLLQPIVGLIDSHRARQITDGLLQAIRAYRAKVVVIDITGVPAVDSKVANHLLQTAGAARLMGAIPIMTGMSAEVAQALVALSVDLGQMATVGDLRGGIEEAERILGLRLVATDSGPNHHPAA